MDRSFSDRIPQLGITLEPSRRSGILRLTGLVTTVLLAIVAVGCRPAAVPPPSAESLALRNEGLALLENEKPAEAEPLYQQLTELMPEEPLGFANLAIAQLRQQKSEEAAVSIAKALELAPNRPDLLAIKADLLAWQGQNPEALELYRQAAEGGDDPELIYALYRHAGLMEDDTSKAAAAGALERLAELRPENLVVLLRHGVTAIENGNREDATAAFLRLRELLWQAPPIAERAMQMLEGALEGPDLEAARVPALRVENVIKSTAMFKSGLVELYNGIQGIPVDHFVGESVGDFGPSQDVGFTAALLDERPLAGQCLAAEDFDGDGTEEIARVLEEGALEIAKTTTDPPLVTRSGGPCSRLLAVDLDNDAQVDLVATSEGATAVWNHEPAPETANEDAEASTPFVEAATDFGIGAGVSALDAIDWDIEGDLDVIAALGGGLEVYRNALEGSLEALGRQSLPELTETRVHDLHAVDLDRDGDHDLVAASDGGLLMLENLRQGQFVDRSEKLTEALATSGVTPRALEAVDLDNDGYPEIVLAGDGLAILRRDSDDTSSSGTLADYSARPVEVEIGGAASDVASFDADHDGRSDLAIATESGVSILQQSVGDDSQVSWRSVQVSGDSKGGITAIDTLDADDDGDLDIVAAGPGGLVLYTNDSSHGYGALRVTLRGLRTGNDKNNALGRGSSVEVKIGEAYQYQQARRTITRFGLGQNRRADVLRIVWNNGVPQNRLRPETNQSVVEEQILKGSCPFLYTWNGEETVFVTDLLWGAPIGMPVAPGAWAPSDPHELVRVDGAEPRQLEPGVLAYDMRITEELWETAYFDLTRLWVVDHPADTEAASSLRVVPTAPTGPVPDEVLLTSDVRPVIAAWDGGGNDVTDVVETRDGVFADGYGIGNYQGIAPEPWSFTFDLGSAPGTSVRLLLDGWIFPADASLNLASAQRTDLDFTFTRLEALVDGTWKTMLDPMGFPAGKTKTLVVETPPLPAGVSRLRIVTSRWLHWDRIAWSATRRDAEAQIVARLEPQSAELGYRGFSKLVRSAPNAPHSFDYARLDTASPWLPVSGSFTRYGTVTPLLSAIDDRQVIIGPGDELQLLFPTTELPPVAPGMKRTLFLESFGWDKDADRNTYAANLNTPLPYAAMTEYPYPSRELSEEERRYRKEWLTREVPVTSELLRD